MGKGANNHSNSKAVVGPPSTVVSNDGIGIMQNNKTSSDNAAGISGLKNGYTATIIVVLIFSMLIQAVISFAFQGTADVMNFNYVWATAPVKNVFHIYDIQILDYPPLIPMLLRLFQPILLFAGAKPALLFFTLKFLPLLSNFFLGVFCSYLMRKSQRDESQFLALVFSILNPVFILNAVVWGQFDSLLVLLLLMCFWFAIERNYILAAIFFALGCLTKLQFCYFVVPFAVVLFTLVGWKKATKGLLSGLLVGGIVWFPFMVAERSLLLPLNIYFGGSSKWPYINMGAFNVWGIVMQFSSPDAARHNVALGLNGNQINYLIILLATCFTVVSFVLNRELLQSRPRLIALITALYTNTIFMLSTQQHERYQIPILAFLILATCLEMRRFDIYFLFIFSCFTFLNEVFSYFGGQLDGVSHRGYTFGFHMFALLDVLVSIVFAVYVIYEILRLRKA